jgi:hypothetical protein
MMAHNVNSHITSVQRANQLMDIEIVQTQGKINWRTWRKLSNKDSNIDEHSDWVPRRILYFANFIEDLFNTKTKDEAFDMIDDGMGFISSLEGTRSQDGKAKNIVNQLFDFEVASGNDLDLNNTEDPQLRELEKISNNQKIY